MRCQCDKTSRVTMMQVRGWVVYPARGVAGRRGPAFSWTILAATKIVATGRVEQ